MERKINTLVVGYFSIVAIIVWAMLVPGWQSTMTDALVWVFVYPLIGLLGFVGLTALSEI